MQSHPSSRTGRIGIAGTQLIFERLGCIFREQPIEDYGIDAHVEFIENGQATGKLIAVQIKSGDSWFKEKNGNNIIFRGNNEHLEYWQNHSLPVIVVLYKDSENSAYWQAVNNNTIQRTQKGWKLLMSLERKVDSHALEQLKKLSQKIISAREYTELSLQDVSHSQAKRYSAKILLNREFTKDDIILVIKDVTNRLKNRAYYRNKQLEKRWQNKEAHVIWLYLYLSPEDYHNRANWICMTQWISKKLSPEFVPLQLDGETIDGDIVVKWNENCQEISRISRLYELPKEKFLDLMMKLADPIMEIVTQIENVINQYNSGEIDEARYMSLMSNFESKVTKLYFEATNIGSAPIECRDLSQQFQNLAAITHNLVLPFSDRGLKTWDQAARKNLVQMYLRDYHKELQKFDFEFEKIN
ncbi:DUF4365 domain-containing protein [Microcoleus sp. Pol17_C1]|uniref:DUF4365 domain-containing protein n=1 Tax=unclassified Microcoleus TaxID=2642155 RepID=UPI002FD2C365